MNKYIALFIAVIAGAIAVGWVWNHIHPWMAIVVAIAAIWIIINYIKNQIKKEVE